MSPVLVQPHAFAKVDFQAQQTANVRVFAALHLVYIGLGQAQLFSVDHGKMSPLHDVEPLIIALTHRRPQRLFGNYFRQRHGLIGFGQFDAQGVKLRQIRGQHITAACFQPLHRLLRGIKHNSAVTDAVAAEIIGHVQLGGGTRLNTDGSTIQLLGAADAQVFVDQKALAVVIVNAGKVNAQLGVPAGGPGGIARQHINLAGLQGGQAFLGIERNVLHLAGIVEDGSGNAPAQIHIQPFPYALVIRVGETRQAAVDTALQLSPLFYFIQGGGLKRGGQQSAGYQNRCCSFACHKHILLLAIKRLRYALGA